MPSFDQFHPILTPNFTLDWLTQSPIKDIDKLFESPKSIKSAGFGTNPSTILQTVKIVSTTMQKIMNQQELSWGITATKSEKFIGQISIINPKNPLKESTIEFILDKPSSLNEPLSRTVSFIKDHFETKKIIINLISENDQLTAALLENNFQSRNNLSWLKYLE